MHRRLRRITFALLFTCLLVGGIPGWAQTISGIIAGTVTDPQGAAMPAVSITVTNPATGRTYVASTDEQGYYRIPEIAPGVYEVTAELGGFQTEKHIGVRASVGRVTVEDFALQIPPQVEVVEVISKAPMADVTSATLRTFFPERELRDLPILTRDINNLALLAPGVTSAQTFSFASTLVPFSVNGSRGRDNNFIIDSVDNNEPLFGGAAAQFTNTDIFAEYTILTNQLKAEFGRNSGATVNVITKSGSNLHHGSLFWFGQHDEFNARNTVEKTALLGEPATFYENALGFTLGGPVKKDRAFYFISYQWNRARNNLSGVFPVVSTLPTPAGLAALSTIAGRPGVDAILGSSTVNAIPALTAPCFAATPVNDPTGSTTNPCFPPGLVPVDLGGPFIDFVEYGTYFVPDANIFDVRDHQASGRLDWRISNTDDFYARYLIDDLKSPRQPNAPAGETAFSDLGLLPEYKETILQETQSLLLNERHYFVNALNEFRFSVTRIEQDSGAFGVPESARNRPAVTVTDNFGGFGSFQGLFPAAGSRFTIGRETSPTRTESTVYQFQDNYSFNKGRHSFKLGVNIVRTSSDIDSMPSDLGQYFYGESIIFNAPGFGCFESATPGIFFCRDSFLAATPFALGAFRRIPNVLTDSDGNITGQGQSTLELRAWDQFYFFQDDIRVSPTFTLNLGVRYERYGQPINGLQGLNPAVPRVDTDNNNLAPRIGFAWSPWSGGVIRGGYGVMYNPMVLNIPLLIWQSGPVSPFFFSENDFLGFTSMWAFDQAFPNPPFDLASVDTRVFDCSNTFFIAGNGSFNGPPVPDKNVPLVNCSAQDTVDSELVNPYVQHFSLNWQQELTTNLLMEIGYVATKGTKLYQRVDDNPYCFEDDLDCFVCTDPTDPFCFGGNPAIGGEFARLSFREDGTRGAVTRVTNNGRSIYHGLQVSLTRRLSRTPVGDFSFTGAYTWSHLIDTASEIFGPRVRFLPTDPFAFIFNPTLPQPSLEGLEPITPLAQDSDNLAAERGNSSFDRRQRLAISYLWEIGPRTGFWKGGWQLSGIISAQSGQPFSPLNALLDPCSDFNGDGRFTNDRPAIGNSNAPIESVALLVDCFNPAAGYVDLDNNSIDPLTAHFVQVPVGVRPGDAFPAGTGTLTAGSAGRNILVGPDSFNFDFAFTKNFRWGEDNNLQFRWEVYNLFNNANPGGPIGNVFTTNAQPSPAFAFLPSQTPARVTGVIPENLIGATDPTSGRRTFLSQRFMNTSSRHMQFGVKLIF
jgi:hypothetical protein